MISVTPRACTLTPREREERDGDGDRQGGREEAGRERERERRGRENGKNEETQGQTAEKGREKDGTSQGRGEVNGGRRTRRRAFAHRSPSFSFLLLREERVPPRLASARTRSVATTGEGQRHGGREEREREAEKELRGEEGKYGLCVQATETSRRRNDRKTEVARGTFRRLRTHSRRPAAEAGSSRRVNRTPTFDDVHTIKKTTIPLCLPILSRSTDILKEWRVAQRYRLPFSSKPIFASEDKYNMNGYKDRILR